VISATEVSNYEKSVALYGVSLAVLLTAFVMAQYSNKDIEVYSGGNYATALRAVRPLAERGQAESQYYLGTMYKNGRGVRQNYAEAMNWYRKAAEQSYAEAKRRLNKLKLE
jgi:TPR repeat protein